MNINLLDLVKNSLTNDVVSKIASHFNEGENETKSVLHQAVPSVISGLMNQASTADGAKSIFNMLNQDKHDGNMLSNVASMLVPGEQSSGFLNKGLDIAKGLFGDKFDGILNLLGGSTGLKSSSITGIISMVSPLVLGALGLQKNKLGLDASGIASLLMSQKEHIKDHLPSGFASAAGIGSLDSIVDKAKANFGSLLGAGAATVTGVAGNAKDLVGNVGKGAGNVLSNVGGHVKSTAGHVTEEVKEKSGGLLSWLMPLLLLLALLAVLFYFFRSCNGSSHKEHGGNTHATDSTAANAHSGNAANHNNNTATAHTDSTHDHAAHTTGANANTATANAASAAPKATLAADGSMNYELGNIITKKLPNNTEIKIAENGAEAQLIKFIETGTVNETDKSQGWINLYDVQFTKGLTYSAKANGQINNIAAILKAYPNVNIKLGGYTDNTGPADVNQKMSQQRADKVKADLSKVGVAAQITKAEGYGPEHPVCPANDTPECKGQNRRVSCRVVKK